MPVRLCRRKWSHGSSPGPVFLTFWRHRRLFAALTSLSQWQIGKEPNQYDRLTLMTFSVVSEAVEIIKAIPCSGEREEGKAETEDAQKEAWRQCSRRLST